MPMRNGIATYEWEPGDGLSTGGTEAMLRCLATKVQGLFPGDKRFEGLDGEALHTAVDKHRDEILDKLRQALKAKRADAES